MKQETLINKILELGEEAEPIRQRVLFQVNNTPFITGREKLEAVLENNSVEEIRQIYKDLQRNKKILESWDKKKLLQSKHSGSDEAVQESA